MENKKNCPFCGEEILSTAKKCRYCGEWLPESEEKKENEQPSEKRMIACPVCAEPIEEGTKVCPYCHEVLVHEETPVAQSEPVIEKAAVSDHLEHTAPEVHGDKTRGLFAYYFVETFFRHYADFSGKSSRKQFWMGYLFYTLIMMSLYALDMLIGIPVLSSIYILAMLIPYIALVVRRLHDIGKSGWWYFIALVPLIGVIWLLVLLCKKGETKNPPVKGVVTDWIILAFIVIISVVGFVFGLKNFSEKMAENMIDAIEAADTSDTSAAMTDFPIDESTMSGGDTTGDSSGLEHASYLGSSSSGQYDYYLKNGDLNIYQKDTNTGSVYPISLEQLSDEVIVNSISDYTTVGSKIVLITNNGAAGMMNADTALAYDMDSESWTYITTAKSISFDSTKNFLLTSSPTDETMEHFEESEIDLSNLL